MHRHRNHNALTLPSNDRKRSEFEFVKVSSANRAHWHVESTHHTPA